MKRMNINDVKLRRNAMRVPEGYFESLAERVMEQTADSTTRSAEMNPSRRRWWLWSMAAAAAVVLIMGFVQVLPRLTEGVSDEQTALLEDDVYEQQVLDYAMVDDADIYAYLSGN